MIDAGAVEDVGAGQGADGARGAFVGLAANVADWLARPHFFEIVMSGAWGWTAEGWVGGGSWFCFWKAGGW